MSIRRTIGLASSWIKRQVRKIDVSKCSSMKKATGRPLGAAGQALNWIIRSSSHTCFMEYGKRSYTISRSSFGRRKKSKYGDIMNWRFGEQFVGCCFGWVEDMVGEECRQDHIKVYKIHHE